MALESAALFGALLQPENIAWPTDDAVHLCVTIEFAAAPRFASDSAAQDCLTFMRRCASQVGGTYLRHDDGVAFEAYAAVHDMDAVDKIPSGWEFMKAFNGDIVWCFGPCSVGMVVAARSTRVGDDAPISVDFVDLTFDEYCVLQLYLTCLVNGQGPEAEVAVHYSTTSVIIDEHLTEALEAMADDVFARGNAYAAKIIQAATTRPSDIASAQEAAAPEDNESPFKRVKVHREDGKADADRDVLHHLPPTVDVSLGVVCDRLRACLFSRPKLVEKLDFHVGLWRRFVGEASFVSCPARFGTGPFGDPRVEALLSDFCGAVKSRNMSAAEVLKLDTGFSMLLE